MLSRGVLLLTALAGIFAPTAHALRQRTNHKACLECVQRNSLWPDRCYNDPNLPCRWDDDYMWRGWNYDVFESEHERKDRLAKTGMRTRF